MPTYLTSDLIDGEKHGLSAGVVVGELVFVDASALNLDTMILVPEARTIADETRICLERLRSLLLQAGCTLHDLVKVNSYLADDAYRDEFCETYNDILAPGPQPAGMIQVSDLDGNARVVLDAVAVLPGPSALD